MSVFRTSRFRRFIAALLFVSIPLTTVGYDVAADNPAVTRTRSVHNTCDANYRLRSETIVQDGAVSRSQYDYDHGNNRVALRKVKQIDEVVESGGQVKTHKAGDPSKSM